MATRPTLHRAVEKTKNTASDYNDNFDMMMDFIDDSIDESKDYVDGFMPAISSSTKGKVLMNDGTDASWGVALPTGTILYYGFSSAPSGWLVCDGSAISRTTYADLYSAIGTTFGAGDESTTFNLPDLRDKFPQGNTTIGTNKTAGLPNITGGIIAARQVDAAPWGAFYEGGGGYATYAGGGYYMRYASFDASRSSSIYGASSTVQPPALTLLPIIKY